ncbi:hypothetical protein [Streptomyces sp. NPDC002187]|uniref:hypothetical protein n=1 Tax=Streptomyces sp. NPDC002187 TaxID=3364637 RepID=UPI003675AF8D
MTKTAPRVAKVFTVAALARWRRQGGTDPEEVRELEVQEDPLGGDAADAAGAGRLDSLAEGVLRVAVEAIDAVPEPEADLVRDRRPRPLSVYRRKTTPARETRSTPHVP